jgi:hypothetical protein
MTRLESESTGAGKKALVAHLLPTLTGRRRDVSLATIASELRMTVGAVKMGALPALPDRRRTIPAPGERDRHDRALASQTVSAC